MSGIHGKDTKPEMEIRRALHKLGFRYQLHRKDLFGKPDLVFPKYRAVIFVNGCFWHGHDCSFFKLPATNTEFWKSKIYGNRLRDVKDRKLLEAEGWRMCIVWECALRSTEWKNHPEILIDAITGWLVEGEDFLEISSARIGLRL